MTDLTGLLELAFRKQMRGFHTSLPGQITSYDASTQKATVKPLLSRKLRTGEEEVLPIIEDVPVIWPRSGGASMTFPVESGDGCLLIFTDRSLDEWKQDGGVVAPGDPRQHALSDAVALMGFVHFGGGGGPDKAVEIKMGDTTITLEGGTATIKAPSVTIDAPNTEVRGNMAVAGNVSVTGNFSGSGGLDVQGSGVIAGSLAVGGSVSNAGVNIGNDHVHGGVESGGSTTDGPE